MFLAKKKNNKPNFECDAPGGSGIFTDEFFDVWASADNDD